ncbi:MAG: hypothetical protein M9945_08145 [Aquamicrobium sp.]|uniref:hypothetical protein n=1 Tax=Aquamicrobium sp. TaxID=1872579 RepID=UPI00349E49DD|nr:hypothetical protein [Aquamicrobium sp.]
MNAIRTPEKPGFLHLVLLAALAVAVAPGSPLMAQGLNTEGTIDAIVGSDVNTNEEAVADDEDRIVAAIEKTPQNTGEVRRRFSIDRVDIVFLPDFGDEETAVEAKAAEFESQITELRNEIQGSAIFYHALDSRSVLLNDVIALEFGDDNGVTIFVAGHEPGTQTE